ncbi:MAG: hypothetical protein IRZ15_15170 [Bryobacteraceae bacterium]|nr:hypothetical protein [Bryobacteraceae bacterium]
MKVAGVALVLVFTTWLAAAGVEAVFVKKVMDDKAIIVRSNGDTYLIEKGTGCLSLWRFEGKTVYISSPGLFLGVGSRLLIPDAGQECRIWDSERLGTAAPGPPPRSNFPQVNSDGPGDAIAVLRRALQIAGYDVPTNGTSDDRTKEAFVRYLGSKGHPNTDAGLRLAMLSLAIEVLNKRPSPPDALSIAGKLSRMAKGESASQPTKGCTDGHWIDSVTGSGKLVKLEDGSIWEVDGVDSINSMLWLPTEEILICGQTLINVDNGEKVRATKLK